MTRNRHSERSAKSSHLQPSPAMDRPGKARKNGLLRAAIEVAFIVFLFYSNLLMGEFTGTRGAAKSMAFAIVDIFTGTNFAIAIVSAVIGYLGFEWLRKRF